MLTAPYFIECIDSMNRRKDKRIQGKEGVLFNQLLFFPLISVNFFSKQAIIELI